MDFVIIVSACTWELESIEAMGRRTSARSRAGRTSEHKRTPTTSTSASASTPRPNPQQWRTGSRHAYTGTSANTNENANANANANRAQRCRSTASACMRMADSSTDRLIQCSIGHPADDTCARFTNCVPAADLTDPTCSKSCHAQPGPHCPHRHHHPLTSSWWHVVIIAKPRRTSCETKATQSRTGRKGGHLPLLRLSIFKFELYFWRLVLV